MIFLASIIQIKEAAILQGFAEKDWNLWGLVHEKETTVWKELEREDVVITSLSDLLKKAQVVHKVPSEALDYLVYVVQVKKERVRGIVLSQEQIATYNRRKLH